MVFQGAAPLLWPILDSLLGLDARLLHQSMMLHVAPWFHPIAMCHHALIQSSTDGSENLPGDLPSIIILSKEWRSLVAIPAHHLPCHRFECLEEDPSALVRIAHLRKHQAQF